MAWLRLTGRRAGLAQRQLQPAAQRQRGERADRLHRHRAQHHRAVGRRPAAGRRAGPSAASARSAAPSGRRRGAIASTACRSGGAAADSVSSRAVSTASGVRSVCAASPTKRRCAASAASIRASAWFTAATSGATSPGRSASGRRRPGCAGSTRAAAAEARRSGRSPSLTVQTPISTAAPPMAPSSSRLVERNSPSRLRTSTSLCSRLCATATRNRPARATKPTMPRWLGRRRRDAGTARRRAAGRGRPARPRPGPRPAGPGPAGRRRGRGCRPPRLRSRRPLRRLSRLRPVSPPGSDPGSVPGSLPWPPGRTWNAAARAGGRSRSGVPSGAAARWAATARTWACSAVSSSARAMTMARQPTAIAARPMAPTSTPASRQARRRASDQGGAVIAARPAGSRRRAACAPRPRRRPRSACGAAGCTRTSRALEPIAALKRYSACSIASRGTTRPWRRSNSSSSAVSRSDSSSGAPATEAWRAVVSSTLAEPQHHAKRGVGAAQQGAHARDQLGHVERLDQVVVGAAVEAGDAILGASRAVRMSTGSMARRRRRPRSRVRPSPSARPRSRIIAS